MTRYSALSFGSVGGSRSASRSQSRPESLKDFLLRQPIDREDVDVDRQRIRLGVWLHMPPQLQPRLQELMPCRMIWHINEIHRLRISRAFCHGRIARLEDHGRREDRKSTRL